MVNFPEILINLEKSNFDNQSQLYTTLNLSISNILAACSILFDLISDIYGRPYNLSDVPMTYMTRSESFKKRRLNKKEIDALYHKEQNTIIIEGC